MGRCRDLICGGRGRPGGALLVGGDADVSSLPRSLHFLVGSLGAREARTTGGPGVVRRRTKLIGVGLKLGSRSIDPRHRPQHHWPFRRH